MINILFRWAATAVVIRSGHIKRHFARERGDGGAGQQAVPSVGTILSISVCLRASHCYG
ncbi:hypothetical protein [Celeribacter sp.]|uniref:hypothetical protein n=1 Tax=Celeribacter sp. TaxID=1890673 RepID=UPI003A8E9848